MCDRCIILESEIERLQLALAKTERMWREEKAKNSEEDDGSE